GALKALQGNPELATVVTTFEFGESLAYLGYLSGQVGDLTRATDDKLARVGTLHQRLRDHVGAVQASKSQWRNAMGIKSGEPNCGSGPSLARKPGERERCADDVGAGFGISFR